MLFAVDVGNSHTVLGLFEDERLTADWRVATRQDLTKDELGVLRRSLFEQAGLSISDLTGMIVSSVVPDLDGVIADTGTAYLSRSPLFVGPGVKTGLPIPADLSRLHYLYDWLPGEILTESSPVVISAKDTSEIFSLLENGWGKDGLICLYSNEEQSVLLDHLRSMVRYHAPDSPAASSAARVRS